MIDTFKSPDAIGEKIYFVCSSSAFDQVAVSIFLSDETTTVNRQPEFTQLDIELSFTQPDYIMTLIERVLKHSWPTDLNSISTPFKRMTFKDAMENYGSDKPDTRCNQFLVSVALSFSRDSK